MGGSGVGAEARRSAPGCGFRPEKKALMVQGLGFRV